MTSNRRNLRILNRTLVISAIHHFKPDDPKSGKSFTSAYIYSKEYFEHGKFKVRAAMPRGDLLRAQIINLYEPNYAELDQKLVERLNGQMEIDLDMVVGGPQMDNTFSLDQINNWTCPSFIVDYVRAYHRSDSSNSNFTLDDLSKSSKDICALAKALNSINNIDDSDNHQEEVSPVTSTSFPTLIILYTTRYSNLGGHYWVSTFESEETQK